ncbi:AarF/ABC1/UbiB kinase family protein [Trichormus variabilis ARAD]|uniref:AarF/ABC1/UbiB kinase family protein n=1 Tax=Trichormus variabilis N2B TaxID=2681315 RepID=A0ABR6S911_ANAVA|nr:MULTISPECIES: AarF/ABC1/UbiB kinase family protein [Nostocaceae]MBC1213591.1 AarF/ABC1/UbiB kinase family protein [Trichormus variabilis ARAD]MBC1254150.1 AarF/ABC1/UbiB kinase family protein [Trichormus variabilis V5]MBC1266500.1 AarF/ABC1/UbiB kinase family protein [Trichormus variabilis FSR]MBC1302879.1 AarF/ABC1/UbiB kinase family protein [Trichormus variabilis N2B]MBC1313595.1 AarF/ABC1/UbiB kinase family protein [Trichormus variabilis PNB]
MGQYQPGQLKRYNPDAIARYYRFRPWLAWGRLFKITWSFAMFVLGLKWDEWQNQVEQNKGKRATQLRQLLTRLGPTFIKVGQALSTRPDLIRKDFLEELIKLQDQLPAFDNAIAYHIIESELDRPISEVYSELSPAPIAAASLGQVYRGRLISGEEVAVKVQRPHLRPTLTLDLYLMRWAASWLAPWLPLNLGHDLTLIVDEFGIKLFEEIDYLNEGRNAEKFAHNFRNDSQVKVPSIYWRFTTSRVLTLEWINGFKLTDTESIRKAGLDPEAIISIGVTSGLQQLLEYGFFHADPHPGNLFAMPDGRMAYIDFGMMDQLEEKSKESLVDALVHLVNKDYSDLALDFVNLGFLTPDTNIVPIIPALETVLGNAIGKNVSDFNFKTITDQFSELMYEYPFRVPAKFALIIRSLVTQEGIALSLNPNFKIVDVGYPYVARRLLTGESPELRRRLLNVLFKDGRFQWQRLENLIAIARSDNNFDVLPTARMGLQFLLSDEGQFLRRQLVLALTEDDRLHTEEVQRLWSLVKDDLQPNRILNVAIGLLTDLSREGVAAILPKATSFGFFDEAQSKN